MCGIVGIASVKSQKNRNWLKVASDTLSHRGPDDAGDWWSENGKVGLSHRRLSILDLTTLGHQPMHLNEHGISIVFNGEIYNYLDLRNDLETVGFTFKSNSDTEVILASYVQWGIDCVCRFNGMFSFALFDDKIQKIFLVRDRAGEKPLFFRKDNDSLFFASELKALLSNSTLPRNINHDALDCYLAMGFIPGELCIFKGYNKLPPAHIISFDIENGNSKLWRYWSLPEYSNNHTATNEHELLEELELLMEDSVKRQMHADVPVGILLSGGVDSSLVTAMAVRNSSKVRTFSIGFSGNDNFDETKHAQLISKYFGTEHTELIAEPTTADLLPTLVKQFDEPIVDSSMFPTWLVSNLVRRYCTVALSGDGGDELFGGYGHHDRILRMNEILKWIPRAIRKPISYTSTYLLPVGFKGRQWLQAISTDLRKELPLVANYFDSYTRKKLLQDGMGNRGFAENYFRTRTPNTSDLIQRITRMDFQNYLPEDILVKVDRASMLNSLEVRSPLLDYRLIEFAFGKVPSDLKTSLSDRKILLKRLTQRVLPPAFDKQRKQGFAIPLAKWLEKGPFRDLFWDTLSDSNCLFDSKTLRSLMKGQDSGLGNGERLFALVQFELWRKHYGAIY